ncbi:MAG: glycine cleavage system protein GcvH [Candidatus Omnitrophica bacterium]|nr:glycine cleavage system protein GcvH [Candidatus Omnitrophota bacterium]
MDIDEHLLYSKEHEWVNIDGDVATVGISDYAQESLGDITFVELPQVDDEVEQFGELASVESVKAASDIFSPMSGQIIEVNEDLEDKPGLINKSPYDKGWMVKIQVSDLEEKNNLMTAEEYEMFIEGLG